MQAALLRIKLRRLDGWNAQRREIANAYNSGITHSGFRLPAVLGEDYVGHLYVIRCRHREKLQDSLKQNAIASAIHYPTLDYHQPIIRELKPNVLMPVSERAVTEILTLPCYPELTMDEVAFVCEVINGCNA
jgi:dTDP-4-amino-4,6-dideoxygalactose transaminase